MGRKNVVKSYAIFSGVDISSNQTSSATNVLNLDQASIHVSWSGTSPVGTLAVQVRNGEDDSWFELDMGGVISISGNSGDHQLLFSEMPFTDIRLVYTATSGTATMDALLTMKVIGA